MECTINRYQTSTFPKGTMKKHHHSNITNNTVLYSQDIKTYGKGDVKKKVNENVCPRCPPVLHNFKFSNIVFSLGPGHITKQFHYL